MQESTVRPNYPPLRPGSRWPFKKYPNACTDEVIGKDPRYVRWCIENLNLELDDEAYKALVWAEDNLVGDDVRLPSDRFFDRG